ncbi:hypothetical protein BDV29DRAFT_174510 [Aspergillus leporis]|uniref:Uncharacterized protein n=1 Tax=Aspergillus leporis TaxID=41062 RepID=A0A5N5WZQ1_9EURO|nr:hypothetical protein BDV29DRAFT_174510 [Aspergillus leporis]
MEVDPHSSTASMMIHENELNGWKERIKWNENHIIIVPLLGDDSFLFFLFIYLFFLPFIELSFILSHLMAPVHTSKIISYERLWDSVVTNNNKLTISQLRRAMLLSRVDHRQSQSLSEWHSMVLNIGNVPMCRGDGSYSHGGQRYVQYFYCSYGYGRKSIRKKKRS